MFHEQKKDPIIRGELLAKATDYVVANGLASLSLRPLAEAIGTSARMLIYHFGSKEALIAEILALAEHQALAVLTEQIRQQDDPVAALEQFWIQLTSADTDQFLRTAFEVWGLALVHPEEFAPFLDSVVSQWTSMLTGELQQAGLPETQCESTATLIVAAMHGLVLNRLTTGNNVVAQQAFQQLVNWLRHELAIERG